MADAENTNADAAGRLEAALERIARTESGRASGHAAPPELAARLDALIAEIRSVLGRDSAD